MVFTSQPQPPEMVHQCKRVQQQDSRKWFSCGKWFGQGSFEVYPPPWKSMIWNNCRIVSFLLETNDFSKPSQIKLCSVQWNINHASVFVVAAFHFCISPLPMDPDNCIKPLMLTNGLWNKTKVYATWVGSFYIFGFYVIQIDRSHIKYIIY